MYKHVRQYPGLHSCLISSSDSSWIHREGCGYKTKSCFGRKVSQPWVPGMLHPIEAEVPPTCLQYSVGNYFTTQKNPVGCVPLPLKGKKLAWAHERKPVKYNLHHIIMTSMYRPHKQPTVQVYIRHYLPLQTARLSPSPRDLSSSVLGQTAT